MNENILNIVATQGVFAVLFCYLLFYVLKENVNREKKYQEIVHELTKSLPDMQKDIVYIKNTLIKI